ncbi:hypothetical protein PY650_35750 [Rhizobium calliandrae]|uniref:Uncharacterized protein n=1 Tax=Rhizobium calliandrae TaxID=1312182 RepID=A0ABT7KQB4_9HYPH|nr:hypothetical protein [Rhizobium calliandrae]
MALSISILGAVATVPASAASDPDYRPPNNPLEDKSCFAVNRAYEKSGSTERFGIKVFELTSTGEAQLYLEYRIIDDYYYFKSGFGAWKGVGRWLPPHTLN